jgi:hypothetical protein
LSALALLFGGLGLALQTTGVRPAPFVLVRDAFSSAPARSGDAFCLLAGDADADGDPDLFVNWHVFAPPEYLWNEGGTFRRRPERALAENPSVADLDASRPVMRRRLESATRAGIYLWHSDRAPFWFVAVRGVPAPRAVLLLEVNRPILEVAGLEKESYELTDSRRLRVPLGPDSQERPFFVATHEAGNQLKARLEGSDWSFFVGADATEVAGPLDLWGRDPHGAAWLDVVGTGAPELAWVRGALGGRLQPPLDPKRDTLLSTEADGTQRRIELPPNYARGRMVQWIDVEGDGRAELYVGNKQSPNALLRFDEGFTHAEDVAPRLGLDLRCGDAFAWLDLDSDGDDDLVALDAHSGFAIHRNTRDKPFERLERGAFGLALEPCRRADTDPEEAEPSPTVPASEEDAALAPEPGIEDHDLLALDLDNDGALELLVTGWGEELACVLFRSVAQGFVEATAQSGLAGLAGSTQVVAADFDADGWIDLLGLGARARYARNERGHFTVEVLPEAFSGFRVGAALDANGDGRLDVALAGRELALARNDVTPRGTFVLLDVRRRGRPAIGARVRAHYRDGTCQAWRIGSAHRGHLSQSGGPLWLATHAENPLTEIEVFFLGGTRKSLAVGGPGPFVVDGD